MELSMDVFVILIIKRNNHVELLKNEFEIVKYIL